MRACLMILLLTLAPGSARGKQVAEKVAVVNLAGPAAAPTARELRAYLIGRGVGQTPRRELLELLEQGELPARYEGPKLDPARTAYAAFRYAKAQQVLASETARALALADSKALLGALREIFVWRAVVAVAEKDANNAVRWFRVVLRLAPHFVLDAARFNPRVQQAFSVAKGPTPQKPGMLTVEGIDEAQLEINGAAGSAKSELPPGPHLVVARRQGFLRRAVMVEVVPAKQTSLPLQMVPETPVDQGRRALIAASAASGKERIAALAPLAAIIGTTRLLVITRQAPGGAETAGLYDLEKRSVSKVVELSDEARLARVAALTGARPPTITRSGRDSRGKKPMTVPLYRRWWFWTAVGVLAAGAGVITFVATRDTDPTLVCCQ